MDSRKYIFAFLITLLVFGSSLFVSDFLAQKKIEDVQAVADKVALDINSSETEFSLLQETSCKDVTSTSLLSNELGPLGDRLSYAEAQNFKPEEIQPLKQSYFLLEIKDYLLMKRIAEKCGKKPTFILYFYSNEGDCPDCTNMGAVLTALRDKYPTLRIYSFDYDFKLSAVQSLIKIYKVKRALPALIVNGDPYYGLKTVDDFETRVPAIVRLAAQAASTTSATTSPKK